MALVDTDNLLKRFSRYLRLERGLSENTIAGYMSDVEKLVDFIDSENLDWRTVTGADLHQFVATLQDLGIGARSQARIISGIKSFFNFLRMEKCIDTNPSELIETPKLGMKLPDVLTVEEVDELVNSFDLSKPEERRNRAIVETLYSCGLRVSELVGLRMSNLYFNDGYIIVEGKGKKQRLVPISEKAIKEIRPYMDDRLSLDIKRGNENILFLNRRGNSRMLLCGECGCVPQCPRCSVPMTYHSANGRLMCHYCGFSQRTETFCPECGGQMKHVGTGTQKAEEELKALFPNAAVLRMDADTVAVRGGHERILHEFKTRRVPILLGTQMVAKGLDFENVTLVGVLAADLTLYMDHYCAAERTFSLLTQVIGRAGRGEKGGRAVIQTYTPENEVLQCAAQQDYDRFYRSEIRMRRLHNNPPFADLFTLVVSGADEGRVLRASAVLRDAMKSALQNGLYQNEPIQVVGPAPAPVAKVNNCYRYHVYLVAKNHKTTRAFVEYYIKAFSASGENRGVHIFVNCNAMN